MSTEDDYAIWWTTQDEALKILDCGRIWNECPSYLRIAFGRAYDRARRIGFVGHVTRTNGCKKVAAEGERTALRVWCTKAMGIVIRRADIRTLAHLPGIVTDFDLVRVA